MAGLTSLDVGAPRMQGLSERRGALAHRLLESWLSSCGQDNKYFSYGYYFELLNACSSRYNLIPTVLRIHLNFQKYNS